MPVRRRIVRPLLAVALAAALAAGCKSVERVNDEQGRIGIVTELLDAPTATATVPLVPVAGSGVEGRASLVQYGAVLVVRLKVLGLPPSRELGLHVHEGRGCIGAGASNVGGHFNPGNAPHGRPGSGAHHAGDLPNLKTDGEGYASYEYDTRALSISGGPTDAIGRIIVISSAADDYRTQPDGNAGTPLACGFIRLDGSAFSGRSR